MRKTPENRPESPRYTRRHLIFSAMVGAGLTFLLPAALRTSGAALADTSIPAFTPADRDSAGKWILRHPDEDHTVAIALPEGFTPAKSLHIATDLQTLEVGDVSTYADWNKVVGDQRSKDVGGPLGGYNYNYNDFCQVRGFLCNVQADMFAWRVLQGQRVFVPGIGDLQGGPRRSVVLELLNLDGSEEAFDEDGSGQVYVKRGLTATGIIFDGEHQVDKLERNLTGHWLFRQFSGDPDKSYIGITDSPDNAREVLVVSAQRKQWGSNTDGSKRLEWQLLRAMIATKGQSVPAQPAR